MRTLLQHMERLQFSEEKRGYFLKMENLETEAYNNQI
jgi:hypothetical protein